ncbi:MAG TPA: CopD family protein [Casimicrobiaceae bacterium]|nr:CopD family protein [Casimicrobiaceae bacterium]
MLPYVIAAHVLAVVVWVGGMSFTLLVLRQGLAPLAPAERLGVLARVFARFLRLVGAAVLVIALTGGWLLLQYGGILRAPWGVHAMLGLGAVMIILYAVLDARHNPRFQAAVAAGDWPKAGALAERIRKLVAVNLVLGIVVIVAGVAGRGG